MLARWQTHWELVLPPGLRALIVDVALDRELRLAAWLVWLDAAAPPGSHWACWAASLPAEPPPLLRTLTPPQADALHFRDAVATAARERRAHAAAVAAAAAATAASGKTAARFGRALAHAASRCYGLVARDGTRLAAMVPLHDLANHGPPHAANLTFRLLATRAGPAHVYEACAPAAPGDELRICYGGGKGNGALLSSYGFTLEGNLADRVPLGPPPAPLAAIADDVRALLDAAALAALRSLRVDVTYDGGAAGVAHVSPHGAPARRALAAAVSVMAALEWEASSPTVLEASGSGDVTPEAVAAARLRRVVSRLGARARESPTSGAADAAELSALVPGGGMWTAVRARCEHKALLDVCAQFCELYASAPDSGLCESDAGGCGGGGGARVQAVFVQPPPD